MHTTDDKLAYSVQGAANALGGVSIRTIYNLADQKRIRIIKVGRRSMIPAADLRALVEAA